MINPYAITDPNEIAQLPEWLRRQYSQFTDPSGEGGSASGWRLNTGQSGAFKDEQGRDVVLWGDDPVITESTRTSSSVRDPSKMWMDPYLGNVTSPDNIRGNIDENNFKKMFPMFLALAGGATFLNGGIPGLEELGGASGPGDNYWSMLADSGATASDALPGLPDIPAGPGGMSMDPSYSSILSQVSNPASQAAGGSSMSWMDTIRDMLPEDVRQIFGSYGRPLFDLAGGIINRHNSGPSPYQQAGQDREFSRQMWNDMLQAQRANQVNPHGSLTWTKDDKGNWTQTTAYNPQEQARLDMFNKIAADRMNRAGKVDLSVYDKPMDWNALGFGALASAAGVQPGGTTGSRPWYNTISPYSNLGGRGMGPNTNPNQGGAGDFASGFGLGGSSPQAGQPNPMAMAMALRRNG